MDNKAASNTTEMENALDMSALTERFGYNLRRTHIAVLSHLSTVLDEFDIRPRQYGILVTVGRNPGANQGQIAEALGIARTNFVPMLDALEKRDLIQRKPSETDRRSYALYLTPKGKALATQLRKADTDHEAKMRRLIGERDAALLIGLLKKLREAIAEDGNER